MGPQKQLRSAPPYATVTAAGESFGGVNKKCSPIYLLVGSHDSGTDDVGCAALGLVFATGLGIGVPVKGRKSTHLRNRQGAGGGGIRRVPRVGDGLRAREGSGGGGGGGTQRGGVPSSGGGHGTHVLE